MADLSQQEKALTKAADFTADAKQRFDAKQRQLASEIEGMRAQWQGQGGLAFQRLHQAWQEKQSRITKALNDFEASLRETERDNMSTDQSQADNMTTFAHRL